MHVLGLSLPNLLPSGREISGKPSNRSGCERSRAPHGTGSRLDPFTQSPHFGSGSADVPQGMIGTLEVEFFGLPSIGRSE